MRHKEGKPGIERRIIGFWAMGKEKSDTPQEKERQGTARDQQAP
jgi:hypothetical protein